MTDIERPWTAEELAEAARVSVWTAREWVRTGILPRLPGRAIRIPASACRKLLLEGYDGGRVQSIRQTSPEEAPPRGRHGSAPDGPLEEPSLGGRDPLHRRIGAAPGDVVIRRVEG